ncbi:hypothetical protein [uncultured Jatrophihabitans sp.]|uniref:hypothetical protein n=1 Tax=uncultured Jatrophihabitans sp. TaxID=1610747 RepID=UPI0035CB2F29
MGTPTKIRLIEHDTDDVIAEWTESDFDALNPPPSIEREGVVWKKTAMQYATDGSGALNYFARREPVVSELTIVGSVESTQQGALAAWEGVAKVRGYEPAGTPTMTHEVRDGQLLLVIRGPVTGPDD